MFALEILRRALIFAAAFAAAGFLTRPILEEASSPTPKSQSQETLKAAIGAGTIFEVLGGYASIAADFAWIKGYIDWTKKDISSCTASMELAVALDPQMKQFWRDAAAIIAFDYPYWQLPGGRANAESVEKLHMLKVLYGREGLKFIDRGLKIFPGDDSLLIQKASIAMSNLDDYKIAEECYRIMSEKSDAPIYILRRYAAILMRNGKFAEALKVLERMYPQIPEDSPLKPKIREQIRTTRGLVEKSNI